MAEDDFWQFQPESDSVWQPEGEAIQEHHDDPNFEDPRGDKGPNGTDQFGKLTQEQGMNDPVMSTGIMGGKKYDKSLDEIGLMNHLRGEHGWIKFEKPFPYGYGGFDPGDTLEGAHKTQHRWMDERGRPYDHSHEQDQEGGEFYSSLPRRMPTTTGLGKEPKSNHMDDIGVHLFLDHGYDSDDVIGMSVSDRMKSHVDDHMGNNEKEWGPPKDQLHEHEEMKHASLVTDNDEEMKDHLINDHEFDPGWIEYVTGKDRERKPGYWDKVHREDHQDLQDPRVDTHGQENHGHTEEGDNEFYSNLNNSYLMVLALSEQELDEGYDANLAQDVKPIRTKTPGTHGLHEEQAVDPQFTIGQDDYMLGSQGDLNGKWMCVECGELAPDPDGSEEEQEWTREHSNKHGYGDDEVIRGTMQVGGPYWKMWKRDHGVVHPDQEDTGEIYSSKLPVEYEEGDFFDHLIHSHGWNEDSVHDVLAGGTSRQVKKDHDEDVYHPSYPGYHDYGNLTDEELQQLYSSEAKRHDHKRPNEEGGEFYSKKIAYLTNREPKFKPGDKVVDFRGDGATVTRVHRVDEPGKSHRVQVRGDDGSESKRAYYEEVFDLVDRPSPNSEGGELYSSQSQLYDWWDNPLFKQADLEHFNNEGIGSLGEGMSPVDSPGDVADVESGPPGMEPGTYQEHNKVDAGPLGIPGWYDSDSGSSI